MEKSRLFNILLHLLQYKKTTAKELADKFEVSQRTIYRDIDVLSSSGIPVYTLKGVSGGIYIYEDYALDRLMFSESEKENLLMALKGLDSMIGHNKELVSKMTSFFNAKKTDWLSFENSTWGKSKEIKKIFNIIKSSILNQYQLELKYFGTNEATERVIDPIKLIYKDKEWYLHAYCYMRNDYRNFKLTRVKDISCLRSKAMIKEPAKRIFKESSDDYPLIGLEFSANVIHRVYDEFTQDQIIYEDKKIIRVEVSIPIDEWLYSYLLSFAGEARIIYPKEEKEKFNQYLQNFAKKIMNS